jgi:hypothetical protein
MKKVISAFVLMIMMFGMLSSATYAQFGATPEPDDDTGQAAEEAAYARGYDTPAYLFSERGDVIATLTVTDVERGWQDYAEFYEPSAGKEFVAVTFEVSMESRGSLLVSAYTFTLLDGFGYMNTASYAEPDTGNDQPILIEDVDVASGETVEFVVIFEVYEDAPLGMLMWQPEFTFFALVDFTDENP